MMKQLPWWQRRTARMALIALLAAVTFAPALNGGFISDDGYMILKRSRYLGNTSGLGELLSHVYWWGTDLPQARQQLYRPWTSFSFWLDYQLGGESPLTYHLSNYLVHVLSAILLLLLLEPMAGAGIGTLTSLLFAVSPTAMTSVGWISGRTDLWALCFSLLYLILMRIYGRRADWRAAAGAAIALFLALCSKEIAVLTPIIGLLLDYVRPPAGPPPRASHLAGIRFAAALIPVLAYFLIRQSRVVSEAAKVAGDSNFFSELPYFAERCFRTVFHTVLPFNYSYYSEFDWSAPAQRGIVFVVSWIALLAVVGLIAAGIRRRQLWAAGGMWFGLVLFVPYSFSQSWAPISDFYTYAGLPGLWLMTVDGGWTLVRRLKGDSDVVIRRSAAAAGALSLLFAVLIFLRLPVLQSDFSLASHMVKEEPRSVRALVSLGDNYRLAGDRQRAEELYRRALQADSGSFEPHLQLSKLYLGAGDPERAGPHVVALQTLAPNHPEAKAITARFLYEAGEIERAAMMFQESFALGEPSSETLFDFGMVLLRLQKYPEAATVYQEVLNRRPNWSAAYSNLGLCFESLGRFGDAIGAYQRALELDPASLEVKVSLAMAYFQMGQPESAVKFATDYAASAPPGEQRDHFVAQMIRMGLLEP